MEETTVADRVMSLIKSENLSASSFADKIGVQRSAISHISKGRNEPSVQLIKKIVQAFPNVNVEWLFMGYGNMYKDGTSGNMAVENNANTAPLPEPNIVDKVSAETKTEDAPAYTRPADPAPETVPSKKAEAKPAVEEPRKVVTTANAETVSAKPMSLSELSYSNPDQLIVFDPRDKTFTIYKQAQ